MKRFNHPSLIIGLAVVAALAYNSWPLGFILDSPAAHNSLASDLAARGHPYYWLFVLGDLITGLAAIALAGLIKLNLPKLRGKDWSRISYGLIVFGALTAICAFFSHGDKISTDTYLSSVAALGL